ncbi:MAG TPA: DUF2203 family protein [Kiritimatiellia bacterium]|nr:DUF2203 family protein [Kiritimatiellia bacterium]HMP96027.1 DUF2203 family protein [Kiritimatiellia bacterium]
MATAVDIVYTLEQANRALPLIRKITADILRAGGEMKAMSRETMTGDHAARLEQRIAELKSFLQELEDLGCSFKDWDFQTGLVEFPGVWEGHPVLFSWQTEEAAVTHLRMAHEAPHQRRPLPPRD